MKKQIKIGIVEDHIIVRQGLVLLFAEEPNIVVKFDVGNGQDALTALKTKDVDILILDIEMPIMDGRELLKKVNVDFPGVASIMFSAYNEVVVVSECIALGAKGFLAKHSDFEKLVDAIFAVEEKGFYFDEMVTQALVSKLLLDNKEDNSISSSNLTAREIEIILLICDGLKSKEIAERLFISTRTVEGHRKNISEKTMTQYSVELVIYAIKQGIYKI
jgi:DNA-binding NarL/FixJ family response regulator